MWADCSHIFDRQTIEKAEKPIHSSNNFGRSKAFRTCGHTRNSLRQTLSLSPGVNRITAVLLATLVPGFGSESSIGLVHSPRTSARTSPASLRRAFDSCSVRPATGGILTVV